MEVHFFAKSDVGQVRSANEDFFLSERIAPDEYLFVVADGMGGHLAGDVASRLASTTFLERYRQYRQDGREIPEAMEASIREANAAILGRAAENPAQRGMGTTFSSLVLHDGKGVIAHIGDSRVYLIRKNRIRRLTTDHSFVEKLVQDGRISPEEARDHPQKNVLYMSLGAREGFVPELLPPFVVENGDLFVLCSDGLCNMVTDEEICEYALSYYPEESVEALVRMANAHGGSDNITLQIVRVGPIGTLEETRPIRTVKPRSKRVTRLALLLAVFVLASIWVLYRALFAPVPAATRAAPRIPLARPAAVQLRITPLDAPAGIPVVPDGDLRFWDGDRFFSIRGGTWYVGSPSTEVTPLGARPEDHIVHSDRAKPLLMRRGQGRSAEVQLLEAGNPVPLLVLSTVQGGRPPAGATPPRYVQNGLQAPVLPVFLTEGYWVYRDAQNVYALKGWSHPGRSHFPIEPLRGITETDTLFVRTSTRGLHLICLREGEKRLDVVTLATGAEVETDWRWDDIDSPRPLAIDYRSERHQVIFWLPGRVRFFQDRKLQHDLPLLWQGKPLLAVQAFLDPASGDLLLRSGDGQYFIATWNT